MNVKLNYNWSVSYNNLIKKDSRKVWKIISTKSNLELFHPFCKKNEVINWEKEKSIDRIEYLNGSIFEREFFSWKEYKGYDLYIRQLGKSYSYVQWRLSEVGNDCQIKITVFPYLFNQQSKEFVRKYADKVPMKRMGKEEELFSTLEYLISDESGYVTGQNISVDGGRFGV